MKAKIGEITGKIPPKTHNLRYLVKLSGLEPAEEMFVFLSELSDVSIPTRYPEDFSNLRSSYDKKAATIYLNKTKLVVSVPNPEAFQWIRESLKP